MKRITTFLIAFICCVALYAQKDIVYKPVLLSIDKADGQYAAGETVNVYGQLMEDIGETEFVCYVESNGSMVGEKRMVQLKQGEKALVYSASFDEPSAVQVYVHHKDNDKIKAAIGFVVAAEGFRPGFDAQKNFDKFWGKQLKTLRKCKMEPELTKVDLPRKVRDYDGLVELYALKINMPEGRPVHAYIAWPVNAVPSSLPIVICLHGAGYSRSNADNAVRWAGKGVIAIDLNAHGYPDDQPKEYYDRLAKGDLKNYRNREVTGHEEFYFRLMYLRAVRAIDYATTLPLWDGKRIMSDGSSQGGAQAIAVAAIDKRVGAVNARVPALTDLAGHLQEHRFSWPRYGKMMQDGDNVEMEMKVLPYYDGAVMIQHTNAKLWIEAGLIDATCPAECVIAAFNVAVSADKKLYTYPYRPHSSYYMDERVQNDWTELVDNPRNKEIYEWLK